MVEDNMVIAFSDRYHIGTYSLEGGVVTARYVRGVQGIERLDYRDKLAGLPLREQIKEAVKLLKADGWPVH